MDRLAATCDEVAQTGSRARKVNLLAAYLRDLTDDDLRRATSFLCGVPLPGQNLAVGFAKLNEALLEVCGWGVETVRLCYREVGDGGETIGLLLRGFTREEPLSLTQAELHYRQLQLAGRAADKVELLKYIFRTYRPAALQYFVKIMTGDLRIGLQQKMVEEVVAAAAGADYEAVREAANRSGDLVVVALAARRGGLHNVGPRLFHPVQFMLAKPVEQAPEIDDPAQWLVEDKFDGIRAQIHCTRERIAVYTRSLEDTTASCPEIVEAARSNGRTMALDGEILAWRDGRALPFLQLQQRLARKKVTPAMLAEVPLVFIAYDLLLLDDEVLLDQPIEDRRRKLESIVVPPMLLSAQQPLQGHSVDALFGEARARGNEGLVLKRLGGAYEPGRRSGSWIKVKRPFATLDVVITAVERGHGRRASMLSDYTFAVRDGDRLVNIGKAYSGLTDDEIRELGTLLRELAVASGGRAMVVKPEVVLEVAFDAVHRSTRHDSGYALRFPRILRWRRDKTADQIDDLDRVRSLETGSHAD